MISFKNSLFATLTVLMTAQPSLTDASVVALPNTSVLPRLELNTTNSVLVTALAASLIRFWTKDGDNRPSRFDWDQVAEGNDLLNQGKYLIDDELIGNGQKGSYQMVDPKTGLTRFSTRVEAKGLYGFISKYHKDVIKAVGFTWLTMTVVRILSNPLNRLTPETFLNALGAELDKLAAYSTLPKYANIGAGALVATYLVTP